MSSRLLKVIKSHGESLFLEKMAKYVLLFSACDVLITTPKKTPKCCDPTNITSWECCHLYSMSSRLLRVRTPDNRVFFGRKNLVCFSALVIAFACKSYHSSQKMSSFQSYWTKLRPIGCFWLFLTTFVLFVLESFVLILDHCQSPLEVAFDPYNKFRTQTLISFDSYSQNR